ncbi:hypothetical protein [Flavobacterium pallidum]|nr:hypothetical protein [Flavobacterium pallidum]
MAKKKEVKIPRPKEDVRIEADKPKFNAVLSAIVKKKPNNGDESTK